MAEPRDRMAPRDWLRRIRTSTVAGNALALYAVHFVGLFAPLVTIPYLARVLRPGGWGTVVFAQSFAAWLALVLEYGFELSGTRAVARVREDPPELARVVAEVQGAKLVVFVVISVAGAGLYAAVPAFRSYPLLFAWAWGFAVARGFSPFWYFAGLERMKGAALVEATSRIVAALGVFLWVRGPGDEWRVLALQAVASGTAIVWLMGWMYREQPVKLPTWDGALGMLREGVGIFIFRASSGLYIRANAFILGLLSTPPVVAYFGGAEKLVRAAVDLLQPISQALFPRLSHLVVTDPEEARRLLRVCALALLGVGGVMGAGLALGAPLVVRIVLGAGYEAAVPILRVLALLPPIIAVGTVFGIQWALPLGHDRPFYILVLAAGALNIVLAVALVPYLDAMGMALAVVSADLLVAAGLVALYHVKGWGTGALRASRSAVPVEAAE